MQAVRSTVLTETAICSLLLGLISKADQQTNIPPIFIFLIFYSEFIDLSELLNIYYLRSSLLISSYFVPKFDHKLIDKILKHAIKKLYC